MDRKKKEKETETKLSIKQSPVKEQDLQEKKNTRRLVRQDNVDVRKANGWEEVEKTQQENKRFPEMIAMKKEI